MKKKKNLVEKTKVTFPIHNYEPDCNSLVVDRSENLYPLANEEETEYGFCSNWNCRNPDGSKVALIDMGSYLQCGQCYRRYDK